MSLVNPRFFGRPDVVEADQPATKATIPPREEAADSHDAVSDRMLMSLVAAGDQASFEALYHRYAAECFGLCRRILSDHQLAQDAVQVAFLAVWENADRFRPELGSVAGWLMTVAHHKAVDLVRVQARHSSRHAVQEWLDDAIATGVMPADKAEFTLESSRAVAAISRLAQPHREVLMLCYYGGFTQTEVATRLGVPLGTVKTRCQRAMQRLRTALAVDADSD